MIIQKRLPLIIKTLKLDHMTYAKIRYVERFMKQISMRYINYPDVHITLEIQVV